MTGEEREVRAKVVTLAIWSGQAAKREARTARKNKDGI